ncbi:MAG: hypothetical protein IPF93_22205 [Saprospiraceae bacterium]|nr:hypothetical protein [Saprospiraceae bacterium]
MRSPRQIFVRAKPLENYNGLVALAESNQYDQRPGMKYPGMPIDADTPADSAIMEFSRLGVHLQAE